MATVLDHLAFRDTQDNLTALHDEWMHSSTGTNSGKQGQFEFSSGPSVSQNVGLAPTFKDTSHGVTLGFSPSDMGQFLQRNVTQDITGGNPGSGGNGVSPPGTGQGYGGSGNGNGGSSGGTSGGNGKPPTTSKGGKTIIIKKGGGGGAQGANAIGRLPQLGNVPYSSQSSSPTGSPTMMLLILGGGVLVIYFIWHKLRKSKAEDKEMDKKGE